MSRFEYLLENKKYSDVTFLIGPTLIEVPSHKFILAAASKEFEKMFNQSLTVQDLKIKLVEINLYYFRDFLKYIYTHEVIITDVNALQLFTLAKKFKMNFLRELASYKIRDILKDSKNYKECLKNSDVYKIEEIKNEFYEIVLSSDKTFLNSIQVQFLKFDDMRKILESDFSDISELELFKLTMRWAEDNKTIQNFISYLKKLILLIRFSSLSPENYEEFLSKYELTDLLKESQNKRSKFPTTEKYSQIILNYNQLNENQKKYDLVFSTNSQIRIYGFIILIRKDLSTKSDYFTIELIEEDTNKCLIKSGEVIDADSMKYLACDHYAVPKFLTQTGCSINPNQNYIVRLQFNDEKIGQSFPLIYQQLFIGGTTIKFHSTDCPLVGLITESGWNGINLKK